MSSNLYRREFLKLLSILPIANSVWPSLLKSEEVNGSAEAPNIIILVFDTLSAPNTSFNGYKRNTTPNLNRFAEKATVFHNHYAGGNFTSPGTASLLTGTYPWTHRAFYEGIVDNSMENHNIFNLFGNRGYTRISYSHNYLVMNLLNQFRKAIDKIKWPRELGLADELIADRVLRNDFPISAGSETSILRERQQPPHSLILSFLPWYVHIFRTSLFAQKYKTLFPRGVPALQTLFFLLEDAIDWLMDQLLILPQPHLIYYHLIPPHAPYNTRREFVDKFRDGWNPEPKPESFFSEKIPDEELNLNRRLYDEYLAYADAEFGRLHNFMDAQGILDNSYLIFTSDHGEMFERGILGHSTEALYQPVIRVPLLISSPGQNQRKDIYTNTSCVDVLPTLLHATGLAIPDWCEGEILPLFNDKPDYDREIYSVEAKSNPKYSPLNRATISLVKGNYKLIHYRGYGDQIPPYELFDLANDPEEREDLYLSHKAIADELANFLQEKLRQVNQPYES